MTIKLSSSFLMVIAFSILAYAQFPCKAPRWDEIRVGITKDKEAVRIYGKGTVVPGGHSFARAYIDSSGKYELIYSIGVDDIIESLTFKMLDSTDSVAGIKISQKVHANAYFQGNAFNIFSSNKSVINAIGEPGNIQHWLNEEDWHYIAAPCKYFINVEMTIIFIKGIISEVTLENGE
jgi:hypothetical protein